MDPLACSEEMLEESPDVSAEIKERNRYKNQLPPEVVSHPVDLTAFVDQTLMHNNRVIRNMLHMEKVSVGYVNNYFKTVQDDVTPRMKRDVAIWMFEVCEEEKMNNAVFIRAVQYMDKFLSIQRISKTQLQLLGAVCMLISSKIAGTTISSLRLVAYTANSISSEMLLEWEGMVLQVLHWDMYGIVSVDFVQHFLNLLPPKFWNSSQVIERIKTFTAYCAVDYQLVHLPSRIAAASVVLAIKPFVTTEGLNQVLSIIHEATQIELSQIADCMEQITTKVMVTANNEQQEMESQQQNNSANKSSSAQCDANGCRIKAR